MGEFVLPPELIICPATVDVSAMLQVIKQGIPPIYLGVDSNHSFQPSFFPKAGSVFPKFPWKEGLERMEMEGTPGNIPRFFSWLCGCGGSCTTCRIHLGHIQPDSCRSHPKRERSPIKTLRYAELKPDVTCTVNLRRL